jgi:hypothetical protein
MLSFAFFIFYLSLLLSSVYYSPSLLTCTVFHSLYTTNFVDDWSVIVSETAKSWDAANRTYGVECGPQVGVAFSRDEKLLRSVNNDEICRNTGLRLHYNQLQFKQGML